MDINSSINVELILLCSQFSRVLNNYYFCDATVFCARFEIPYQKNVQTKPRGVRYKYGALISKCSN